MMRSLYSGVSGLRTHQTRMDVIGNNIANVNTTAYKAKSINFSDMLYQTTQAATGPNTDNGTAGTNPRQIGLGVKTGAINTSITTEGATQSTGNPFDLKLTGEAFFVVSDGTNQYFTRDGSFNVDAAGYLCMGSTGYIVQGWTNTDANTGAIIQDSVKPIQIMSRENSTYPAAYTTAASISGIVDMHDDNLDTENGRILNVQTLDNRGYEYNLKFGIKPVTNNVTSTKNVTNTERLYQLPGSIACEDISTLTYFKADGTEIKATGLPSALLKALEEEAKTNKAGVRNGQHTDGTEDDVTITISDAFLTEYNITDLGDASTLKDSEVRVHFSGDTGYVAYKNAGGATASNVAYGTIDISTEAMAALYGAAPALNASADLDAAVSDGLLVIEKTYTDGTDNQYEFRSTDGNDTVLGLDYTDISKLLATDASPKVQAQYTSVEDTTLAEKIDGSYTIELISMTDSNGDEIDTTNLGDNTRFNVVYDISDGDFSYVGSEGNTAFTLNLSALNSYFSDVSFDMSTTKNVENGGKSTVSGLRDDGRKVGSLTGVSIGTDGVITANYSNGMSKSIAQIAVATFANAMGLQNEGDNLYSATANSGDFDGVGVDIKASGTGYMTTGVLEMSNVDLSQQFTDMITTQRGFQANSRIITTSDTLLEELVNLKR
ncbi:MAG: flagellar hook-basal body complex protein [Lachnospiraceae bacterium]|nr:flagellar hook-basal body complex protein [Lachnospiraceae bacterium]